MKNGRMQCKDIPDGPVLQFLAGLDDRGGCWFGNEFPASVTHAMPAGTPEKLALGKMRMLMKRGLVDGCGCGCRGDFELTDAGRAYVNEKAEREE